MPHTSEIDNIPPGTVDQVVQDFQDAGATNVTKTQVNGSFTVIATFNGGDGGGTTNSGAGVAAPIAQTPGHAVTVNPPYSVTGRATMFGLNWDGTIDGSDNGIGFFTVPGTTTNYNTRDTQIVGCSLPREVMLSTFLSIDAWKTYGIEQVWADNGSAVQKYVLDEAPSITIDSGGRTASGVPLVDAGPNADTGNAIDLTYFVAHELNTNGAALATYEILVAGNPLEIKGWNWTTGRVG
jgi:hypothetical protein